MMTPPFHVKHPRRPALPPLGDAGAVFPERGHPSRRTLRSPRDRYGTSRSGARPLLGGDRVSRETMPETEFCNGPRARVGAVMPVGWLPQGYLCSPPVRLRNGWDNHKRSGPWFIIRSRKQPRGAALALRAVCHDWLRSELRGAVHDSSAMYPTMPGRRGCRGNALWGSNDNSHRAHHWLPAGQSRWWATLTATPRYGSRYWTHLAGIVLQTSRFGPLSRPARLLR